MTPATNDPAATPSCCPAGTIGAHESIDQIENFIQSKEPPAMASKRIGEKQERQVHIPIDLKSIAKRVCV